MDIICPLQGYFNAIGTVVKSLPVAHIGAIVRYRCILGLERLELTRLAATQHAQRPARFLNATGQPARDHSARGYLLIFSVLWTHSLDCTVDKFSLYKFTRSRETREGSQCLPGRATVPPVLRSHFPPFSYLVSHRLNIDQAACTEPSPAVACLTPTNPLFPSFSLSTFPPHSNSPRRLTTYRTP